jgi:putative PIN family toxin of toxin-antitoxin system
VTRLTIDLPDNLAKEARDGRVMLYTSMALLKELADVLTRDKFAPLLASQEITPAFLMQRYGMLAKVIRPSPIGRTVPTDADDDVVIATALAAQANVIVSGDSDLLALANEPAGS